MKSVEYLNKILTNNRKLRQYKSRLSQLQTIRNNYYYFDNYANDLNTKCRNTINRFRNGLKIQGGTNNVDEIFKTNDLGRSDGYINESENNINAEIRRVQQVITELERTISADTNKMNEEKAKEKAEMEKNA